MSAAEFWIQILSGIFGLIIGCALVFAFFAWYDPDEISYQWKCHKARKAWKKAEQQSRESSK
ncbi:gp43 [Burkholderia phage Bcep781]|uniref:Gp43 n=1 Tax=Burkholderia phage Bcep781 TaxID=2883946 RepID=Q546W5_9CAUD|nr:gp43 [Burkholderia phage Bcep781]AAT37985.1 gp43 [Burkholderia phage Bcep781]